MNDKKKKNNLIIYKMYNIKLHPSQQDSDNPIRERDTIQAFEVLTYSTDIKVKPLIHIVWIVYSLDIDHYVAQCSIFKY